VQGALAQLSPRKRVIFELRSDQGLSAREIAEQLGISVNTVKFQLMQATKFLRSYFRQHADLPVILCLLLPFC
jgi:RNA polymerase sigma-70 factor (ECF subfamily)